MEDWIKKALELGFTHAGLLNISALRPEPQVRQMCAADKCGAYGKNWTCPPHCGSLEQCEARIRGFSRGILLQTVGKLEKTIDTKGYRRTEEAHLQAFHRFCREVRLPYPEALCLGTGGCRVCPSCAWPEPCRLPEMACPSMEAYGLFVTRVCRDSGMDYYHGEKTVTYTACVLLP